MITNHAHAALRRWPKDPLRPDCQLQDALAKRVDRPTGFAPPATGATTQEQADLKQINALYALLEDRYKTMVGIPCDVPGSDMRKLIVLDSIVLLTTL